MCAEQCSNYQCILEIITLLVLTDNNYCNGSYAYTWLVPSHDHYIALTSKLNPVMYW